MQPLVAFLLALITSAALTPAARRFALAIGAVDRPAGRKVHTRPMPRLGGLAVYCGFWVGILYYGFGNPGELPPQLIGVFMGSLMLLLLGLYDDMGDAPVRVKLPVQLAAAHVAYFLGTEFDLLGPLMAAAGWTLPHALDTGMTYLLTLVWIVGVTNALNFLDGLDGLASGLAFLAAVTLAALAGRSEDVCRLTILAAFAGAVAGFQPFNRHPASIFLGDTGSTFLGFALANFALLVCHRPESTLGERLSPMLLLAVPLSDALFAIVRRLAARASVFQADRGHLHHRMLAAGMNPLSAARWLCLVAFAGCIIAGASALMPGTAALATFAAAFVLSAGTAWRLGLLRLVPSPD